jgi:hypothetical protein
MENNDIRSTSQTRVFISYSRRDSKFADKIYSALIESGVTPWIDRVELTAGKSLLEEIGKAVLGAHFVVAILSPHSVSSNWVRKELLIAMTLEVKSGDVRVIPLLYKECQLPAFLIDKIYCDFQKHSQVEFTRSINILLQAIDPRRRSSETDSEPYKVNSITNQIIETVFADDRNLAEELRDLPLANILNRGAELRSFSGVMRRDILGALAMVSNAPALRGGVNLVAFLAFLKGQEQDRPRTIDFSQLTTTIIEDRSISEPFRWFALRNITTNFTSAGTRSARLALLPDVFRGDRLDPLADQLITEFFDNKDATSKLDALWALNAPLYRVEILMYLISRGNWKSNPSIDVIETSISPNPAQVRKQLRPLWKGILNSDPMHAAARTARETLEGFADCTIETIGGVSVACEIFACLNMFDLSTTDFLTTIASPDVIKRCAGRYGRGKAFKILVNVIASPYIDAITSSFAIFTAAEVFGLDSLMYDSQFPGGLMRQKQNHVTRPTTTSVIELLIHQAQQDDMSLLAVKSLASIFPHSYFLAFIRMSCKAFDPQVDNLKVILAHVSSLER